MSDSDSGDSDISAMQMLASRLRAFGNQLVELKKDTSDLKKKVDRLIFERAEDKGAARFRNRLLASVGALAVFVTLAIQIYVAVRTGK